MKQEGHEAGSAVKKAGEALEDGFVAVVQAPRHLAEAVKHQVCCWICMATALVSLSDVHLSPVCAEAWQRL